MYGIILVLWYHITLKQVLAQKYGHFTRKIKSIILVPPWLTNIKFQMLLDFSRSWGGLKYGLSW